MNFISHKRMYCKRRCEQNQHSYFPTRDYSGQNQNQQQQDVIHIDDSGYEETTHSSNSQNSNCKNIKRYNNRPSKEATSILAANLTRHIEERKQLLHNSLMSSLNNTFTPTTTTTITNTTSTTSINSGSTSNTTTDISHGMKNRDASRPPASSIENNNEMKKEKTPPVIVEQKRAAVQEEKKRGNEDVKKRNSASDEKKKDSNIIEKIKLKIDGEKITKIEADTSSDKTLSTDKFECEVCMRRFLTEKMLNLHKEILHAGTVYKCPSCAKTFSLLTNMRRHLRDIHKYDCFIKIIDLK